jgi:O-methyltransferase
VSSHASTDGAGRRGRIGLVNLSRFGRNRDAERLYLELLKRALTGFLEEDPSIVPEEPARQPRPFDPQRREDGRDWPTRALTMVGLKRLDNLERCVTTVLRERVPGDFIETGVWRGGASIFVCGVLRAHGETRRHVWLADSFAGLPRPDGERYPADTGDTLFEEHSLAVSLDEVKHNFACYGLLDDRVHFLPGWFRDTLPTAPIEQLAVLRLDGDLYESTIVALESLYTKVARGGFVVVDDYGALAACRAAVDDYRREHGIVEQLHEIDWTGVYWRRGEASPT